MYFLNTLRIVKNLRVDLNVKTRSTLLSLVNGLNNFLIFRLIRVLLSIVHHSRLLGTLYHFFVPLGYLRGRMKGLS